MFYQKYFHFLFDAFTSVIPDLAYKSLGCWKDKDDRAIPNYEPEYSGISQCYARAKTLGNEIFAVQNGKECWTTATAIEAYNKYGVADDCCSKEGTGGPFCKEVYEIGTAMNRKF